MLLKLLWKPEEYLTLISVLKPLPTVSTPAELMENDLWCGFFCIIDLPRVAETLQAAER